MHSARARPVPSSQRRVPSADPETTRARVRRRPQRTPPEILVGTRRSLTALLARPFGAPSSLRQSAPPVQTAPGLARRSLTALLARPFGAPSSLRQSAPPVQTAPGLARRSLTALLARPFGA